MNHILRRGPSATTVPSSLRALFPSQITPPPPLRNPASYPIASRQASPFSHRDGLSLMQIYNHFICRCLPRTACRNIAQHHASKMSCLTQAASLASSQSPGFTHLSRMEINVAEGPPGCIPSWRERTCVHVCAVLVHILQKVICSRDGQQAEGSPCFSCLTRTALPSVC